jgi:hypothetical protein
MLDVLDKYNKYRKAEMHVTQWFQKKTLPNNIVQISSRNHKASGIFHKNNESMSYKSCG